MKLAAATLDASDPVRQRRRSLSPWICRSRPANCMWEPARGREGKKGTKAYEEQAHAAAAATPSQKKN